MIAYRLTSIRSLARFLVEHPEAAKVCQFKNERVPSYRTFCRRFGCLDNWVLLWCRTIITFLIDAKILKLKILIIDGELLVNLNAGSQEKKELKQLNQTLRQNLVIKNGAESAFLATNPSF